MTSFISQIRNSKILKRFGVFRSLAKSGFRLALRLVTGNKGVKIHVGKRVDLRLDYCFYFNKYENWGANHNDGYNCLLDHCQPGYTVIDVGAHIGLCALSASRLVEPGGKVIAFEPSQTNYAYLQDHIRYNNVSNTQAYPFLVGETNIDGVPFYESSDPTGMNAIVHYKNLPNAKWVNRRQISIDDFCTKHSIVPNVIKIDVEGAEIGVLKGAKKTIETHTPTIIISVHPRHLKLMGESECDLHTLIQKLHYNITDVEGNAVNAFELKEYIMMPSRATVIEK